MRSATTPILTLLTLLFCCVATQPVVAQERELERLKSALAEMSEFQQQLEQKLEIAADKGQEGNVKEITHALKRTQDKRNQAERQIAELKHAMENQRREGRERERSEQDRRREREEVEPERHERPRVEREQRGDREASKGREQELNPELRAAMSRLNHMRQALAQLREAGMNDLAELLQNEIQEYGNKVERSIKNSRAQEQENRRDRERLIERERNNERPRNAERERDFDRRRTEGNSAAERMDGAIKEFSYALREMRNEIQELRNQMEEMRKDR